MRMSWACSFYPETGRQKKSTSKTKFKDVTSSTKYYSAIRWCVEKDIMKSPAGKFKKNSGCTRGQTVTFLYRYSK